jgi:hypothetical protein
VACRRPSVTPIRPDRGTAARDPLARAAPATAVPVPYPPRAGRSGIQLLVSGDGTVAQLHEWMFYEFMWRAFARGAPYPFPWWVQQSFRRWSDAFDGGLFDS